jgi:hypothetical protein
VDGHQCPFGKEKMENQEHILDAKGGLEQDASQQTGSPSMEDALTVGANPPSPFELKRQNRIQRLKERAERKRRDGEMRFKRADEIASYIPSGQPILVGHHSERRHRKDLERIQNSMRKGFSLIETANHLEQRAASAESNDAIFTEDPQAITKLEAKIEDLEKAQARMKEVNRRIRAGKSLLDLGISASAEENLKTPDFLRRVGFPDYALKNNNANIRRLKARLEAIRKAQAQATPEEIEVNGIRLVENTELNRVQLFFPGKPAVEVRDKLKSDGFRWSPFNGCWQRHRSPLATHLAKRFLEGTP